MNELLSISNGDRVQGLSESLGFTRGAIVKRIIRPMGSRQVNGLMGMVLSSSKEVIGNILEILTREQSIYGPTSVLRFTGEGLNDERCNRWGFSYTHCQSDDPFHFTVVQEIHDHGHDIYIEFGEKDVELNAEHLRDITIMLGMKVTMYLPEVRKYWYDEARKWVFANEAEFKYAAIAVPFDDEILNTVLEYPVALDTDKEEDYGFTDLHGNIDNSIMRLEHKLELMKAIKASLENK